MALAPDDEAKRHRVVEQAHSRECEPGGPGARHSHAEGSHQRIQDHRGQSNAQKHDREGWQRLDQDGCEEERAAPQNRQQQQREPLASIHAVVNEAFALHLFLVTR
jgi:hypothetical protein